MAQTVNLVTMRRPNRWDRGVAAYRRRVGSLIEYAQLGSRLESALATFLRQQRHRLVEIDGELHEVADAIEAFVLGGGKRIRPAFAYWGFRGADGKDDDSLVKAVASLELLQASALIHDDLMDDSDTRRGEPSIHRKFESKHQEIGWAGDSHQFGSCSAILLGDLCMTWSDEMFTSAGMHPESIQAAREDFDAMRTEVCAGQYLDVLNQVKRDISVERALKVAQYKSAKYTIERPLLMGAALAGGSQKLREVYSGYGLPLGEAFQLRDDVLGVYGDPKQTGKPAGDDLREGKHTYLIACAYRSCDSSGRKLLDDNLGNAELDDEGIAALRTLISDTGALATTEQRIDRLADEAAAALRQGQGIVSSEASTVLAELADAAVRRAV